MQPSAINEKTAPFPPMTLKELIVLIIKEKDLHEGIFTLELELQIAVGGFGPTPELVMPGAMFGVSRIGLTQVQQVGPQTVDAAQVNPLKAPPKKRKTLTEK